MYWYKPYISTQTAPGEQENPHDGRRTLVAAVLLLQVLADVKKVITDEDLLGLVSDNMDTADAAGWEVIDLHVSDVKGVGSPSVLTCAPPQPFSAGILQHMWGSHVWQLTPQPRHCALHALPTHMHPSTKQ